MDEKEQSSVDQYKPIIPASNLPDAGLQTQDAAAPTQPPTEAEQLAAAAEALVKVVTGGGSWFYWIAALSVINTLTTLARWDWSFVLGLGFTQMTDAVMKEGGQYAPYIILPLNLGVSAAYFLFGYYACRAAKWAFITGIALYSLDTLLVGSLLAVGTDTGIIIMLAFHVWALISTSKGLKAAGQLQQIRSQAPAAPTTPL